MSIETERLVNDSPPTPEQLHKIASIGVSSAVSRERFKSFQSRKGVHYLVDEVDFLAEPLQETDMPSQIRHRMAMRVAAYPATDVSEKLWSLKYFNTYFVENEPGQWAGERSTYRFEWTRSRILMAERSLQLFGFNAVRHETVEDTLEHFHLSDDSVAMLHASDQLKTVSRDDCEYIIDDMTDYFDTVNAIARS